MIRDPGQQPPFGAFFPRRAAVVATCDHGHGATGWAEQLAGTSKNAVMPQIWIALCIYLLLACLKFQSMLQKSTQQILRLLQLKLFEKRDLIALFKGGPPCDNKPDINQMVLL